MNAARKLGRLIAIEGWRLVYGAGDIGLMGEVASAAKAAKGSLLGVMPKHLVDLEVARQDLDTFVVTETMHERKKVMFMNSDAALVLPGGCGTLDEFFEVLTWRHLGLHEKEIVVLNVAGYWNHLKKLITCTIDEGFANHGLMDFVSFVQEPEEAIDALRSSLFCRRTSIE